MKSDSNDFKYFRDIPLTKLVHFKNGSIDDLRVRQTKKISYSLLLSYY